MNDWTRRNKEAYDEAERIASANRLREENERYNRELRDRARAAKEQEAREHVKFMQEASQRIIRDIEKENQKNFYENLKKKTHYQQ